MEVDKIIPEMMKCLVCQGFGKITEYYKEEENLEKCDECEGTGLIKVRDIADRTGMPLKDAYKCLLAFSK